MRETPIACEARAAGELEMRWARRECGVPDGGSQRRSASSGALRRRRKIEAHADGRLQDVT